MVRVDYSFIIEIGNGLTGFVNHLVYILNYLLEVLGCKLRIIPLQ